MSRDLVSLEQAQRHLKRDEDQIGQPEPDLAIFVSAASEVVLQYLKDNAALVTDTFGYVPQDSQGVPLGVPANIKNATLVLIGYLDMNRDSDDDKGFDGGHLPQPVKAILSTLRVPTLR